MNTFENLNIIAPILKALAQKGYTEPSPIQAKSIPVLLDGKDIFGCAQTGTGKTAAFAVPILQILHQREAAGRRPGIKALILAPTRELAIQIDDSFRDYGKGLNLKHTVIFGGVSQLKQTQAIRAGVDILVATPGRLLDLMNQRFIHLDKVEFFVLDEADRMLDMGFIHDIKRIIPKLPAKRQTVFFSATIPDEIKGLAASLLTNPVQVQVAAVSAPATAVKQTVYYVEKSDKNALLHEVILKEQIGHALVFTRTKHGADKVVKELNRKGISAEAIHGNKSQNARQKALTGFKNRAIRILVATDIASRGIDVDKLTHVINYELPEIPETYVHRIGRTGRAGESGIALSFCGSEEIDDLKNINKLLPKNIEVAATHQFPVGIRNVARPAPGGGGRGRSFGGNRGQSGRAQQSRNRY
jgi:ATP-dependent RNA helicase RhlE